jgi:hypothetical protein
MSRITCDEAEALMRQALGDDDAAVAPTLEVHVSECGPCADAWRAQHDVRAVLASREPEPVPAGFAVRLEAAIDDLQPWWARYDWRSWTIRLAPVTALLVLLGGGAAVLTSTTDSPPAEASPVSTALWDDESAASSDSLLLAVLSGSPDDPMSRYQGSTR